MPAAFIYLLKLSVSLGVVFLFYQFVLRRLTFYNWNRWYLLGYSLLSFVIPFIDITPALHQNELADNNMVQWIPLLYNKSTGKSSLTVWNIISLLFVIGMLITLSRLIIQLISFRRMMKKAQLISEDAISLYQVDESIIPFSFGNAVFFNVNLHTTEELEKIIRHEFVHVKQRHSIDIIFSEILCLLNWYNPFAWMLRSAIRQNLEFVADNKVLENGINKKQYQYLLLKVIGDNQFSIAQKFNFSSLKKRIAMMNKNKSAKMHLLRFLFVLPVLAVILVSFRKEIGDTLKGKAKNAQLISAAVTDTIPDVTERNSKGYIVNVKNNNGDCLLVIKDKGGKEVKRLLLTEWNADAEKYEAIYGEIPPPPPQPPVPPAIEGKVPGVSIRLKGNVGDSIIFNGKAEYSDVSDAQNTKKNLLSTISDNVIYILDGIETTKAAIDNLNPEMIQSMDVLKGNSAIALYGEKGRGGVIVIKTKKPGAFNYPVPPAPPEAPTVVKLPDNVQKININNKKATVTLKNGQKENYDLNNAEQKAKFEIKYGEFVSPPPPPPAKEIIEVPAAVSVVEKIQVQASAETANSIEVPLKVPLPAMQGNPLIIVDGVIIKNGQLDKINPNSIESINVLKGNSAITLYGEKGTNGVIIIKTKTIEKVKPITQTLFLFPVVKNDGC
jgi:TonB-dependent SusC/RagA subfamily outer membrane receptor